MRHYFSTIIIAQSCRGKTHCVVSLEMHGVLLDRKTRSYLAESVDVTEVSSDARSVSHIIEGKVLDAHAAGLQQQ